jgi:hypothetical protein
VDGCFHGDINIQLSRWRSVDLETGEVEDGRHVNEADIRYDSGPESYPELVELFFQLADELL